MKISMTKAMTKVRPAVTSLLSGACMVLAFSPWHWHLLAPILLAYLYNHWQALSPQKAWWSGYAFGLGLFGCGVWWVFIAVHSPIYGIENIFAAGVITLALIAFLSCFPAFAIWSMQKLALKNTLYKSALLFPSIWVVSEWLRGHLFTGFPWMSLGYSQLNTPLEHFAPIFGVYGVSFLLVSIAGTIAYALTAKQKKIQVYCLTCVILVIGIGSMLGHVQWTQKTHHKPFSVALLQMNIPITAKWHLSNQANIINTYESTTRKQLDSDIIVWPEGSIPAYKHQYQDHLDQLAHEAMKNHSALLAGLPTKNNGKSYNSIVAIGTASGIYKKRHLVPFGEYWPLLSIFEPATRLFHLNVSMYTAGPDKQPAIDFQGIPIAPYICYEITYPELVRRGLKNSQLIVTVTDDAWFGNSIASPLHLEIAQMRSLENGRYQLFSANTGISAIINDKGKILATLPLNKQGVLKGQIEMIKGNTPWQTLGHWPVGLLCLLILFSAVFPLREQV